MQYSTGLISVNTLFTLTESESEFSSAIVSLGIATFKYFLFGSILSDFPEVSS